MTALLVAGVVCLSAAVAIVALVFYHESHKATAEIQTEPLAEEGEILG